MRLDEDFWLKLAILTGFGFLGAFISHLNFLRKERKRNPGTKEKIFNSTLFITACIGTVAAIGLGFFLVEFTRDVSPGFLLGIGIVLGYGGSRFLEKAQELFVNQLARSYGFEIRQVEKKEDE